MTKPPGGSQTPPPLSKRHVLEMLAKEFKILVPISCAKMQRYGAKFENQAQNSKCLKFCTTTILHFVQEKLLTPPICSPTPPFIGVSKTLEFTPLGFSNERLSNKTRRTILNCLSTPTCDGSIFLVVWIWITRKKIFTHKMLWENMAIFRYRVWHVSLKHFWIHCFIRIQKDMMSNNTCTWDNYEFRTLSVRGFRQIHI